MNKEYEIKTIEQILDIVTEENMECFLKDFQKWLSLNVMTKMINKQSGDLADITNSGVFHWIDDGKNDANITIKITDK